METGMPVAVQDRTIGPFPGARTTTNSAYLVYVAIDNQGRPQRVPPLIAETDGEREMMEAAYERQAYRKQQRQREKQARQRLKATLGSSGDQTGSKHV